MKRVFTLFFAVVLIISLTVSAYSASEPTGKTVYVDEYNFSVRVPDGYYYRTRDMEASAEGWSFTSESDRSLLLQQYMDSGTFVDMFKADASIETMIMVIETAEAETVFNLNSLSDAEFKVYMESADRGAKDTMAAAGADVGDMEAYETGSLKFLVNESFIRSNGTGIYIKSGFTIVNGILLNCVSYSVEPFSTKLVAEYRSILDSIDFSQEGQKPAGTGLTLFVDEYGFSVRVPDGFYYCTRDLEASAEGWSFTPESVRSEVLKQYKDSGVYVDIFMPDDPADIMISVKETEESRTIFNLSSLSDAELKEFKNLYKTAAAGSDVGDIETYETDDLKFLLAEGINSSYGSDSYVKICTTVVNGIILQCTVVSAEPISADLDAAFRSITDSIEFSQIEQKPASLSPSSASSSAGNTVMRGGLRGALIFALIGAAIGIPLAASKKRKQKAAAPAQQQIQAEPAAPGAGTITYVCSKCGTTHRTPSAFCPDCGAKDTLVEKRLP